jgi:hypothetical protein
MILLKNYPTSLSMNVIYELLTCTYLSYIESPIHIEVNFLQCRLKAYYSIPLYLVTGSPDWANFRLLGGALLWAVFYYKFSGYFFPWYIYVLH